MTVRCVRMTVRCVRRNGKLHRQGFFTAQATPPPSLKSILKKYDSILKDHFSGPFLGPFFMLKKHWSRRDKDYLSRPNGPEQKC